MKSKSVCKIIRGMLCCCVLPLVLVNEAKADGTEQLGLPSIPIAPGSHILVEGTGLKDAQPGAISIAIPADATIAQILLYWTGRSIDVDPGDNDTIQVNGMDVTGPRIGGPTPADVYPSNTYRADITEIGISQSWILAGQTNVLSVSGLDFAYENDGAAVVVILDDGSMVNLQIMDGNDFAYLPQPYDLQTMPVDFSFAPSADPRLGSLWLIVTDIDVPRPAAVDITVDGVTTRLDDVLQDNEGDYLDVIELEVLIPAGATNVTVQLFSIDDGSGLEPASLAWTFVAWKLPEPDTRGCTYTIGFWKNHPYDWPTDNLSLYTGHEAMMILWTPPKKGNAYIILAHQYIGAELNVVNGTSIPDEALDAWLSAQELLEYYQSEGNIPKKSPDRALAIDLAGILDDYNNGIIGPGHCD